MRKFRLENTEICALNNDGLRYICIPVHSVENENGTITLNGGTVYIGKFVESIKAFNALKAIFWLEG